jgi:hypothetical protein
MLHSVKVVFEVYQQYLVLHLTAYVCKVLFLELLVFRWLVDGSTRLNTLVVRTSCIPMHPNVVCAM